MFRNAPISEVAADLRRWYGVELRVTDSALLKRHYTGVFGSESPNRVVERIALSLGADINAAKIGTISLALRSIKQ